MATLPTALPLTVPAKRLTESITASSTSFLISDLLKWDGTTLTSADLGEVAYGAFRDTNGTVLEIFSYDPTTIASATGINFVHRGLKFNGDRSTEVMNNKLTWVRGTTIVELGTDFPQLFQYLVDYINNIAVSGAPVASATVLGISKASVAPASPSAPIFVGDNDPRVPTQSENDALVGDTGTPSSTNKFLTQTSEYKDVDQTQTAQDSAIAVGEANATTKHNKLAQSFIPTVPKIRGARLYKTADTGTFTGSVKVAIQADSAGSPSGTDLASGTIANAAWIAFAVGEFEAALSTNAVVTIGALYWIVITPSTSDNSNHPNIGQNSTGGYANGSVKFNNSTDNWVAVSTVDLYFKILGGGAALVPIGDAIVGMIPTSILPYGFLDISFPALTITGTTAATSIYKKNLPVGTLTSVSGFKVKTFFVPTGTSGTSTVAIALKLNGTTIYTFTTGNINNGVVILGEFEVIVFANASTSAQNILANVRTQANLLQTAGGAVVGTGGFADISTATSAVDVSGGAIIELVLTNTASAQSTSVKAVSLEKIALV